MENFNERKLKLLENIEKSVKATNDEIDWFIASFVEKDPKRRALARTIFNQKRREQIRLAKEAYERFK